MRIPSAFAFKLALCFGKLSALGVGIDTGLFDLEFGMGPTSYVAERGIKLDNPICFAIEHQKRLALIVELKEILNKQEMQVTTKKLVVDPYAFGFTRDKKPVLRGNVVGEKELKKITTTYNEDRFDYEKAVKTHKGWFTGWFKNKTNYSTIDISKVTDIDVMDDSYFYVPDNLSKSFHDELYEVVCQVHSIDKPVPENPK